MKGKTLAAATVTLLALAVALPSCSRKKEPPKEGAKTIGVSLLKENDDFYVTLKKGLNDAAAKYGYNIAILSADSDEIKQQKNMDALLVKGADAVVICPVNSKGVGSIIKKANDRNVPVFTADIAAEEGKVVAHIASDNYLGGKIAAQRMKDEIGAGLVAVIQIPGTESVMARVAGFVDTARELNLEIIEPFYNGKDDTQESERVANAAIKAHPDLLGIFAANDNMAEGAESAIKASEKNIVLIGYDAAPAAQAKIKAGGPWKADVIQYPARIGEATIQTIDRHFKGELQYSGETINVPVEVGIVDSESLR
ncbi:MAG: substrate-binding domain-containing protein [bacterium]